MKTAFAFLIFIGISLTHATTAFSDAPKTSPSIKSKSIKIIFLGDSLTEGYGVEKSEAYPSIVEKILTKQGTKNLRVINGGISGSTTAGGLSRLNWLLKGDPTHLVLALGANDGLRGLKIEASIKNMTKIIETSKKKGLKVLIAGMKIPPNYGPTYASKFESMFTELAKKHNVPLMPFLLDDVAGIPALNISDGIHPNAKGHKIIAKNMSKYIQELIHE